MAKPLLDVEKIEARQEAIRELAPLIDWRQHYQARGRLAKERATYRSRLTEWAKASGTIAEGKLFDVLVPVFPFIAVPLLVIFLLGFLTGLQYLLIISVPLAMVGSRVRRVNQAIRQVGELHEMLRAYAQLLQSIEGQQFHSKLLVETQEQLKSGEKPAGQAFKELTGILEMLDNRANPFVGIGLNALMLWDFKYIRQLQQWQRKHGPHLNRWWYAVGVLDALSSLANFSFNHPNFVFPQLEKGEFRFSAENLGHPLIPTLKRINNTFALAQGQKLVILTGANMAGKSTFLRTVGVNLVLAQTGAPVCASGFSLRPVPLFTSMRTTDSLQQEASYFFAELSRLKTMVEKLEAGGELFIILDEILKGTNSKDKENGSKALLRKLVRTNAAGLVATHDLGLCELENEFPATITNQCFEVEMANGQLTFDYRLRNGVCQNMNASYLLKSMGITD